MRRAALTAAILLVFGLIAGQAHAADAPPAQAAPPPWALPAAGAIVIVGAALILRRVDVRMVLLLCALPLFLMAGRFPDLLRILAREMANLRTVVPICSAVGFAHVLALTECDKHLVHLLLQPLRRFRSLLIPGGIAAGYLVNSAVVSQAGSAAVVGPILIPLLRAGGIPATTAGALLVLGCSMGGELFNPGAVEIVTMARLTGLPSERIIERMALTNFVACSTALLAFWALAVRGHRRRPEDGSPPDPPIEACGPGGLAVDRFRVNPIKAIVPILPMVLLFTAPRLLPPPPGLGGLPEAQAKEADENARAGSILVAMLIGSVAAGLTSPGRIGRVSPAFCEGAGYGYTHVISLIVTGTAFAEGIKACGLLNLLTRGLGRLPTGAALLAGTTLPWGLATICGSGIAPAVAVMQALLPTAEALGLDPVRLGTVIALGAHFGRTMSPVAAVVFLGARLSGADNVELVRRLAPPLLIAGVVLFLATWLRPA